MKSNIQIPDSKKEWCSESLLKNTTKTHSGCLEWKGARKDNGYGRATYKNEEIYVHRLSWLLVNGPIPKDLQICHTCDNRICINPKHLFLGTRISNMADASRKMRVHPKLTIPEIRALRLMYKSGRYSHKQLGFIFHINESSSRKIILRLSYKEIPEDA